MFRPAALFIGLRYTRAKRRNHFISLISLVSLIGIALGVTVLITVLSVMNGFQKEIKERLFSMVPAMTISSHTGGMSDWQHLQKSLSSLPFVKASAPFIAGQVLLTGNGTVQPALISGVDPKQETDVIDIAKKMVQGKLTQLMPGEFGIVLGEELAGLLNASVGDKITVVTPEMSLSPLGAMPRFKRFTLVGTFNAGGGFGFDRSFAFIELNDAQKLFGMANKVSGVYLKLVDNYQAPFHVKEVRNILSDMGSITTWADQFGPFFHAMQLEKTMMFIILLLIIAVAAFNLVSTLMMVVSEKEADIAILRTFGATPATIMWIFIFQGCLVGIFGTVLGVIGGIALASNVTNLVHFLEYLFHVQFLSSDVYMINQLPSQIEWTDVVEIAAISFALSMIATILPAWRASKLDPVESLRYE